MHRKFQSLALTLIVISVFGLLVVAQKEPPTADSTKEVLPVLAEDRPTYYKGNLHTHSLWSDGDDFPEMIADWYKRHGYHFLALSDHNILARGEKWVDAKPGVGTRGKALDKYLRRFGKDWVERRTAKNKEQVRLKPLAEYRALLEEPMKYLLLPAEEITHRFAKAPVHVNAINVRDVIPPADGDSIAETIKVNHRSVFEQTNDTKRPMFAFLNHPNFGWGIRAEDMMLTEELKFFEIYNGHPGVRNYGDETHPSTERLWDLVLALRLGKYRLPIVYGLATDDAHRYHEWGVGKVNPGRGWIMVKAPHLTGEAIVKAVHKGDFYSSTGVELLGTQRVGKKYTLRIHGEEGVEYRTQFLVTMQDTPLSSKPRVDADGKELPVTRVYSNDIGKVVHEAEGLTPTYELTGKELYLRAKVISTKPHPNPYAKGDVEVAWTQPIVP